MKTSMTPENPPMTASHWFITALTTVALAQGCASSTPRHLLDVRAQYAESGKGLASRLTPTELYDAKNALDRANQECADHGDSQACRDLSYIAQRKVELANAKASTELDRVNVAEAVKAGVVARDSQVTNTRAALAQSREQIQEERRDNTAVLAAKRYEQETQARDSQAAAAATATQMQEERRTYNAAANDMRAANTAQGKELEVAAAQLEEEKKARLQAETKLAGAMKDLAAVAAVRDEARGVVITLSGSVLFASGKHELLNTAMTRLDQVAEALKAQDSSKRMVVEGHTDSMGSDGTNQPLSLARATAVRDYLVSRGVPAERISAEGKGSSSPVVDNRTPENRSNNRRVEIIIGNN